MADEMAPTVQNLFRVLLTSAENDEHFKELEFGINQRRQSIQDLLTKEDGSGLPLLVPVAIMLEHFPKVRQCVSYHTIPCPAGLRIGIRHRHHPGTTASRHITSHHVTSHYNARGSPTALRTARGHTQLPRSDCLRPVLTSTPTRTTTTAPVLLQYFVLDDEHSTVTFSAVYDQLSNQLQQYMLQKFEVGQIRSYDHQLSAHLRRPPSTHHPPPAARRPPSTRHPPPTTRSATRQVEFSDEQLAKIHSLVATSFKKYNRAMDAVSRFALDESIELVTMADKRCGRLPHCINKIKLI